MNDFKAPAEAKLSSTLLLLRGEDTPEVLMVARSYEIDFASGAFVFPGGKVSADDRKPDWKHYVRGEYSADELAVRVGGVREVFEESGILIAKPKSSAEYVDQSVCEALAPFRSAIDRGEQSFLELIRDHALELCLDALIPFAHWVTPEMMPKRFDTRFFVVRAPNAQLAKHDGRETMEAVWVKPADILARAQKGEATVIFPTRLNLEKLEDLGKTAHILNTASSETPVTVMPRVEKTDDGAFLVIPDEAGYRITREPFESVAKATAAKKG